MPNTPRPTQDQWCDVEGTPIALPCWVEQVAEDAQHGAPCSRLHKQGEVLGRGPGVLYVRFQGEGQLTSMPPQLLRLLPNKPDEHGW